MAETRRIDIEPQSPKSEGSESKQSWVRTELARVYFMLLILAVAVFGFVQLVLWFPGATGYAIGGVFAVVCVLLGILGYRRFWPRD